MFDDKTNKMVTVFTGSQEFIKGYINLAFNKWKQFCIPDNGSNYFSYNNIDNPPFSCSPKIYWYGDPRYFEIKGADNDFALMKTRVAIKQNECKVNCDSSFIRINDCDKFLKIDSNNKLIPVPRRFFYMRNVGMSFLGINISEIPDLYKNEDNEQFYMKYYDFYGAITHEIGHWFGFGDKFNHESCKLIGSNYNGIMFNKISPLTDYNLSEDDTCMFKKVYCCSESFLSVENFINQYFFKFDVYPNPATNMVTVKFATKYLNKVFFEILDIEGNILTSFSKDSNLDNQFQLDIANYPTGTYFIKTKINNNFMGYKFIKK